MDNIEKYLTIVLITYNREKYLSNTLEQFLKSPFASCNFVVLNNCSKDGTELIARQFQKTFVSLKIITNKFNIGSNANIMRAIEYSDTEYTWIVADDDDYDFSECYDIIEQLKKGDVNLIQVGGHADSPWLWGMQKETPRNLRQNAYPFFKYSSFIASSIFKTDYFIKYAIEGYQNIMNSYPHMPYLLKIYMEDQYIYIAKKRIVIANPDSGSYNNSQLLNWWIETSKLLLEKQDRIACFIEQYNIEGNKNKMLKIFLLKLMCGQITKKQYMQILSFFNLFHIITFCCYLFYSAPIDIAKYLNKKLFKI